MTPGTEKGNAMTASDKTLAEQCKDLYTGIQHEWFLIRHATAIEEVESKRYDEHDQKIVTFEDGSRLRIFKLTVCEVIRD